jgi:hypothetical protein
MKTYNDLKVKKAEGEIILTEEQLMLLAEANIDRDGIEEITPQYKESAVALNVGEFQYQITPKGIEYLTEKYGSIKIAERKKDKAPKKWWAEKEKEIKKGNPKYTEEQVQKTVGKIWRDMKPETKTKVNKKYRGSYIELKADEEQKTPNSSSEEQYSDYSVSYGYCGYKIFYKNIQIYKGGHCREHGITVNHEEATKKAQEFQRGQMDASVKELIEKIDSGLGQEGVGITSGLVVDRSIIGSDNMLPRKNMGGELTCNICGKEIPYYTDYYVNERTKETVCENDYNKGKWSKQSSIGSRIVLNRVKIGEGLSQDDQIINYSVDVIKKEVSRFIGDIYDVESGLPPLLKRLAELRAKSLLIKNDIQEKDLQQLELAKDQLKLIHITLSSLADTFHTIPIKTEASKVKADFTPLDLLSVMNTYGKFENFYNDLIDKKIESQGVLVQPSDFAQVIGVENATKEIIEKYFNAMMGKWYEDIGRAWEKQRTPIITYADLNSSSGGK